MPRHSKKHVGPDSLLGAFIHKASAYCPNSPRASVGLNIFPISQMMKLRLGEASQSAYSWGMVVLAAGTKVGNRGMGRLSFNSSIPALSYTQKTFCMGTENHSCMEGGQSGLASVGWSLNRGSCFSLLHFYLCIYLSFERETERGLPAVGSLSKCLFQSS